MIEDIISNIGDQEIYDKSTFFVVHGKGLLLQVPIPRKTFKMGRHGL